MKAGRYPQLNRSRQSASGMSLIVLTGILAILAIFSLSLLRALIREVDHEVARKEMAILKTHKHALEQAILRNGYIPGPSDWAAAVASELGQSAADVMTNPRHRQRQLLVDPTGWLTNLSLSYTQTIAGLSQKPVNARMMIVSSLGDRGPFPSVTNFSLLWNRPDTQDDTRIERIVLDPLFVELRLVTAKGEALPGRYAIGPDTPRASANYIQFTNAPRYLLRGTHLWLFTDQGRGELLDARQILTKNGFYKYESGIWKSSMVAADLPGGLDLAAVVKGFLDAVPNTNALHGAQQQKMVVDGMMEYMRGYIAWGKAGFPSGTMKTQLETTQRNMMYRCMELFKDGGNPSYFPINNGPCE